MRVYRIERARYVPTALSGLGAAQSEGARWNSLHTPMVYTSESRALAMLEVAVHLDLSEDVPTDRYLVVIDIPDDLHIMTLNKEALPPQWEAKPPTSNSQRIGDDFIRHQAAAVFQVPSAIVSDECNYLINPLHPEAVRIRVVETAPFAFDLRWTPNSSL